MKNLRNRNQPVNADLVQVYLQSSWDIVTAVYAELDDIQTVADAINSGGLGDYLTAADIDTLAELNAIVTDATLGDAADFATAAQGAKVDFLTVTQPVDLDQLEARVNDLDAAVVLRGTWDASSGSFPGSGTAQAGDSWIVNVAGTVDSVDFAVDDRIIAVLDNASTSTFVGNWHKADYTDLVTSVAGLTGAITDVALRSAINVEDGATADQTNAEIRAAVEAAADSNVFTDADHSKLDGIESAATADQTDAEIRDAYHNLITLVSQAEAEAGTSTTIRTWTAERVKQAIVALGSSGNGLSGDYINTNTNALAGTHYQVDTTGGAVTLTLPASPVDGDYISFADAGGQAGTNFITVGRNGNTIDGAAADGAMVSSGMFQIYIWDGANTDWKTWSLTPHPDPGGGGGLTVEFKTVSFTAVAGKKYKVDTSGGAVTVTLPAGTNLDNIVIQDVGHVAGTNNITINPNGAETIDGDTTFIIDQNDGDIDIGYDSANTNWEVSSDGTPDIVNVNDYFTGFAGINAQTGTTYTFAASDLPLCVTASNASASTYSIPDSLAVAGETLSILNIGAGTVTVDCPGTDTLASTANDLATGKAGTILKTGATTWWLIGGA